MSEFVLPALPFDMDALAPAMSRETLEYHYGKHHQTYVTNLNKLIAGTEFEDMPLGHIIVKATGGIFNNAAQVYNHAYFWKCLSPNGGGRPEGALLDAINAKWGSFEKFREEFSAAAAGNFGSGWTWLVMNGKGELSILNTSNAGTPKKEGFKPVIALDVWEHAYYIDYRNARPKFIDAFFDKLVNWEFAQRRFAGEPCGCGCRGDGSCCGCSHKH